MLMPLITYIVVWMLLVMATKLMKHREELSKSTSRLAVGSMAAGYSWDDFMADVSSNVGIEEILEKCREYGLPKRPRKISGTSMPDPHVTPSCIISKLFRCSTDDWRPFYEKGQNTHLP